MRYTVFCGSSSGNDVLYATEAFKLGETLAEEGIGIVYGGAKVGLMGEIADGAIHKGGEVIGVLPHFLHKVEVQHNHLSKLIMVDTMHERKAKMHELSDGVIALPGGYGTLEEFFELLTWGQLGLHKKPIALFNVLGFFDPLLAMIKTMVVQGFLKQENSDMIIVDNNLAALLDKMKKYTPPSVGKWL